MKTAFDAAGDVRAVDLLAAFVSLWRAKTSGSLRFSRGGSSAGYDFAESEIVAVFSSEPRFETSAILVRAGKLDASALERLSMPPGADAALAALQTGILTRREWKWGEKIRAIEILADLLTWPDGKYLFDSDARPERGEFVLTIPRLILELFLRSRDRNLIDHQLGATDVPLRRSAHFDEEFSTFGLTADAESVVQLIDGGATAAEISERAPAEEFAVLKLLAALTTLGLLQPAVADSGGEGELRPAEPQAPEMPEPPPFESWRSEKAPSSRRIEEPALPEGPSEVPVEKSPRVPRPTEPSLEWERGLGPPIEPEPPPIPAWEEPTPLDRPLVDAQGAEDAPSTVRKGRFGNLLALTVFVLLLAVVVGIVLLRSRATRPASTTPVATPPTAASAPPTAPPTAIPAARPTALSVRALSPERVRPTAAPSPRPTPRPTEIAAASEGGERASWVERARRDRRRLQQDPRSRYSIQLELVCETRSLSEAWKHDQPAGSLWLLTEKNAARECFRVLWGRYRSIEEAKKAKPSIPGYFVTSTNHPAVVGVR